MSRDATAKKGQPVIRAYRQGIALRNTGDGQMPTLHGHFAVFNRWTEIDSWMEGNFLERIAPGAFKKTFREQTPKVLFQHGQDPTIGDKPLGPVKTLAEDGVGAAYEVPLLDTAYNRELVPGLEAGLYGASFRFQVLRQEDNDEPAVSDDNPRGLPERTIKEARVMEFGPVTFPAYADATAGVRSLTDRFLFDAIERNPARARDLLGATDLLRMDVEDLDTLAQMMQLAAKYVAEQDEPDDQANIPKMKAILSMIADLVPVEVAENEEPEINEDDQAGRSKTPGRTLTVTTPPPPGTSDAERREADQRFNSEREWQEWLTS